MSDSFKILICCHKKTELPIDSNNIFFPIQVGASLNDNHWGIQRDDEVNGKKCLNISEKNKSYCELTAMYWAWKNIKILYPNLEYIGLNHYRRFFLNRSGIIDLYHDDERKVGDYKFSEDILDMVKKGYTILAEKKVYPYSLAVDYSWNHLSKDLNVVETIIHEMYPEYDSDVCKVLHKNNKLSHFNMFIMKFTDFEKYCEWLFPILEEGEKRIDIEDYTVIQKRIWGYIAERLLNVYVLHNMKKIKYKSVIMYAGISSGRLNSLLKRIRYNLSFFFNKPINKDYSHLDMKY